jgi:SAM-dependent methyltransferase
MDNLSEKMTAIHRAYGKIASLWDKTVHDNYDFALHEQCRDLFTRYLPGKRILEVGCGLGWDSTFFSLAGYDVTATDFQEAFVTITQSRNPAIHGLVMDMLKPLPFDTLFHGIYGFAAFLHIPRELSGKVLRNMASLLCEGGILFLHHVKSIKGFTHYTQENLLIDNNPVSCYCHSEDEMRQMLIDAGLSPILLAYYSSAKSSPLSDKLGLSAYQVLSRKQ